MDLSVVIPLYNERDNLEPVHAELGRVLEKLGLSVEVLYIDDGSIDGSDVVLRRIAAQDARVRVLRLARNSGQTAALACGFAHARGNRIVAMDADGENDPADLPRLLRAMDEGYDLVSGWRTDRWRNERLRRRIPSVVANALISRLTGLRLRDYGCTFKAYRRELAQQLRLYGEMHRFIPAIAAELGAVIGEIPIGFRPRRSGRSKYGASRAIRTILDLITVLFLRSYATRPIQVFGSIGLVLALSGGMWAAIMTFEKLFLHQSLANRPALLLSVLLLVVGVQFISLGLLAEMVARTYHESQNKPIYVVREEFQGPR